MQQSMCEANAALSVETKSVMIWLNDLEEIEEVMVFPSMSKGLFSKPINTNRCRIPCIDRTQKPLIFASDTTLRSVGLQLA